jgi:UDP-galactopyranose mutase
MLLKNVIFGGRLADYAYYDMDKTIGKALDVLKMDL